MSNHRENFSSLQNVRRTAPCHCCTATTEHLDLQLWWLLRVRLFQLQPPRAPTQKQGAWFPLIALQKIATLLSGVIGAWRSNCYWRQVLPRSAWCPRWRRAGRLSWWRSYRRGRERPCAGRAKGQTYEEEEEEEEEEEGGRWLKFIMVMLLPLKRCFYPLVSSTVRHNEPCIWPTGRIWYAITSHSTSWLPSLIGGPQ